MIAQQPKRPNKQKVIFLTFNDAPSGIYSSQVIEVVKYIRQELGANIRLLSMISLRAFFINRRKIKKECPDAIVLPMFPGVNRWRKNTWLLRFTLFALKPDKIVARSVIATQLSFLSKNKHAKIIYDGRGAIAAEWNEYGVVNDPALLAQINHLEKEAIVKSHFRIAVSDQLLYYWQKEYNYQGLEHVIIPCTLNSSFENTSLTEATLLQSRKSAGFSPEDTVFVFSGSVSGWQGFDLLYNFIKPHLHSSTKNKILFLSPSHANIEKLHLEFPEQVRILQVSPSEVPRILMSADYGLLIREQSITNKVASPVKFAEYLACGCELIISANLGDYSAFVEVNNCGHRFEYFQSVSRPLSMDRKKQLRALSLKNFTKDSLQKNYRKLLEF